MKDSFLLILCVCMSVYLGHFVRKVPMELKANIRSHNHIYSGGVVLKIGDYQTAA